MRLFIISFLGFLLVGCDLKQEEGCTDMFKMVNIEVTSTPIDSFYTLRASTGEVIHLRANDMESFPVLNDTYQDELENATDTFYFIGLQQDSIVIKSPFLIRADNCHIHLIEGKTNL